VRTLGAAWRPDPACRPASSTAYGSADNGLDTTLSSDDKPTAFDAQKHVILDKLSKDRERSVDEVVGDRQVLTGDARYS
jgi:hypothetical protein